jgi:pimeloyl-ACP methyl ester carboxylesterase
MSGPYGKDYRIQKEVEDVDALLTKTGAHYVFGVSSGALIVLQAALGLDAIHKAVIFEPPLIVNGSLSTEFISRYNKEIDGGDVIGALVTGMLGAQMGPSVFKYVPRGLLKWLTKLAVAGEDKKAGVGDVTMRMLAPTLRYDFQLASELAEKAERFKGVRAEALLLGGSKSPAYLKAALDTLEKVLPNARRVELEGAAHGATGNKDRGGQPERVAQEFRQFFG